MSTQSYRLQYPIEAGGETVDEVTIRRPKRGDYKRLEGVKSHPGQADKLIADLAQLTPQQVLELDMEDYDGISGVIEGFLPAGMRGS
jgi:hypothetical protein